MILKDFFCAHSGTAPNSANIVDVLRAKFNGIMAALGYAMYTMITDGRSEVTAFINAKTGIAFLGVGVVSFLWWFLKDNRPPAAAVSPPPPAAPVPPPQPPTP